MDDNEIIALFHARSEQAIIEVAEKYGATCNKIARNILNNFMDAEECVNDAYLGAWNTIPPQDPEPLSAYIYRIVRNQSITKYHANTAAKRNSLYDTALDELEGCLSTSEDVESTLSAKELSYLIDSFLDTLNRKDRIIFVRRYWYSDPIADIAAKFHISGGNVSVRLHRIREKLRKYLKKGGYVI